MLTPICGTDGAVMTCTHTGRRVLTHTEDGLVYQLWSMDEFTCPACKVKVVVTQPGAQPIDEHWKPSFEGSLAQASRARGGVLKAYYGTPPTINPTTLDAPETGSLDAPSADVQNPPGHAKDTTPAR